jgi:O-antigen/teichoic acid export membrane protein
MAEVISIRVFLFFVAFFLLRPVMFSLIQRPNRFHALGLLGVSTFLAFLSGAFILDDHVGDTMVAWFVIYLIIAFLWFGRWKGQEYERVRRRREGLPERDERWGAD